MIKHFVYSISFFLFSASFCGTEGPLHQETANHLVYGGGTKETSAEKAKVSIPTTLWERFCVGQHCVYLGGLSIYVARNLFQKPTIISKTLGGMFFLCGAALVTAVIYPFSVWQKPVEEMRESVIKKVKLSNG